MNEFLSNLASGIAGGLIVWFFQQYYTNKRERDKLNSERYIVPRHHEKLVTSDVIHCLKPGASIELMKETLGVATKKAYSDSPLFSDTIDTVHSYIYNFINAIIKIVSKDDILIDSITVLPKKGLLNINDFCYLCEQNGNENPKVCTEMIQNSEHESIWARLECCVAIKRRIGNPEYKDFVYFVYSDIETMHRYNANHDIGMYIGEEVAGFCISGIDKPAYFIYEYELR